MSHPLSKELGQIVVKDHGRVEVIQADDRALISLQAAVNADVLSFKVNGDRIDIGGYQDKWVSYRVTGYDERTASLVVERIG